MKRLAVCAFVVLAAGLVLAPGALASAGVRHAALGDRHAPAAGVNFQRLGDTTTYAISGHVLDYSGNPVAGAEVDWGWWDNGYTFGGTNFPNVSDSSGAFWFGGVTTAPTAGNDDLDVQYFPTSPGLEEMESWSLNFSINNDATTPTPYSYEMQPGEVDVTLAHAPAPVAEFKVGLMATGFASSDVDLSATTPVASVLLPGFDDVVAYYYGPIGNCTAQTEWLADPDNPVAVSPGTTDTSTVALDWDNAQYASLAGPLCQHSGKPGTTVKMILKGWPTGEQSQFVGYYGANSSSVSSPVTSSGLGATALPLKISAKAPIDAYEIDTYRVDAAGSFVGMWDYFQVCTFKTSASAVRHGKAVRLSGRVPGSGKVTIYRRTKASGQPSSLTAKGWVKVGTYKIKSGKFLGGLLHPKRTAWYVAKYKGWDFSAFTSVVKVRVH